MSRSSMILVSLLALALIACAGYVYERAGAGSGTDDRTIGTAGTAAEIFKPVGPACSDGHFVSSFEHRGALAIMRSECVRDGK